MSPLALVTGGSRGIGACVVAGLRAAGWDVLAPGRDVLDFSHERRDGYFYRPFPFSRKEDHLDAVVFCHGTWFSRPLADITPNDWHNQLWLRVVEPWLFLEQVCMRALTRAGGVVVAVSSTQAFGGRAETGPYAAACAAQVRLVLGLAQSVKGIRANVVCPGLTATSMAEQVRATGDCRPDAVAQPPEAVAAAVCGLVTDGVSNGKVLRVVDAQVSEAKWSW